MDINIAKLFVEDWITAWNSHNLNAILTHYLDEIVFHSPFIQLLKFNNLGIITNKDELKKYFKI